MGSFDCAAASHSRSSRFALDDSIEVVTRKREGGRSRCWHKRGIYYRAIFRLEGK